MTPQPGKYYRKHGCVFLVDFVEDGRVYVRRWQGKKFDMLHVSRKVWDRSFGKVKGADK